MLGVGRPWLFIKFESNKFYYLSRTGFQNFESFIRIRFSTAREIFSCLASARYSTDVKKISENDPRKSEIVPAKGVHGEWK